MNLPLAMPLFAGLALVWALFTLLQSALAVGRVRVPAMFWWAFPTLMLTAGGVAAWNDAILAETAANSAAKVDIGLIANGHSLVVENVIWAGYITAFGASLSAILFAVSGILRVGAFGRFKWTHAIPGVLGFPLVVLGIFGGWQLSLVTLLGALAITLGSVRLGSGADRRRGMANRGLVASAAAFAPMALGLAHYAQARWAWFQVWSFGAYQERSLLLADATAGLPMQLGADFLAAVSLAILGAATLLPAIRAVLDARAAGGFLFSVFLGAVPLGALALGLAPTLSFEGVDELEQRRKATTDAGIELVKADVNESWTPRTPLTVGLYWATLDGERLVPFKEGRIMSDRLDDGAIMESLAVSPIAMEIDRRADMKRMSPLLLAARRDGADVCVVFDNSPWSCMPLNLTPPGDDGTHVLLRNIDATLVLPEGEPLAIDLTTDRDRIAQVPGPLVVHADENLTAERFLTAMAALHAIHPGPQLVLPRLR